MKITWVQYMRYPVFMAHGKMEKMLDIMEELIPITDRGNSFDTITGWMRQCEDEGLITDLEFWDLQVYLIAYYGGF